jgi:hypothetical protein
MLQFFVAHEDKNVGFAYDTHKQCIRVINLKDMKKMDRHPLINSGQITELFVDK